MGYKQVILVREDLKLDKGKMAAQVAHASVEAALRSDKEIIKNWRAKGMKKVVLKVKNKEELFKYKEITKNNNLKTALITDAGRTAIEPGTKTCLAIGPDEEKKIDEVTGSLKMM